jgi:hypothetical protein
MATQPRALFGTKVTQAADLRFQPGPDGVNPKKIANISGAPLLAQLLPLGYDIVNAIYKVWSKVAAVDEVQTLGLGAASSGTFTLSFDGETTTVLTYDDTAADIQAALEALSNLDPGDVVVTGGDLPAVVTLTFGGNRAAANQPEITLNDIDLAGQTVTIATTVVGASANGVDTIAAFVFAKDGAQTHATNDTIHSLMTSGLVDARDVPLPSGESQAALDAALKAPETRKMGFVVQGLEGVA